MSPPTERPPSQPTKPGFWGFYRDHFVAEHQHPLNVGRHIACTLAGTVFLPVALASPMPWLALLYPVVHAALGLLGEPLVRAQCGGGRCAGFAPRDFSPLWFIAGNHVMTTLWLRATLRRWLRGG